MMEIVAPMVGGVKASDGSWIEAKQKIDGGPSILYDAVAVLASKDGATLLSKEATAKDFVTDAFAHCKFIAYSPEAMTLFEKAGIKDDLDEGCVAMTAAADAKAFLVQCRNLRHWAREAKVDVV